MDTNSGSLNAISPVDGRYRKYTEPLARFLSHAALIRHRAHVEVEYLLALSAARIGIRRFSAKEVKALRAAAEVSAKGAAIVDAIEWKGYGKVPATHHDLKAVEYFLKMKLARTSLKDSLEWIHFALTSEDVNNIAYGLMLRGALGEVLLPALEEIHSALRRLAKENRNVAMLARTHGQPASPTTFGKEFAVCASRLARQIDGLRAHHFLVKLNGASGNYNAHVAAFPKVNWVAFTKKFVAGLNKGRKLVLEPNFLTTQIEPHDTYAELFDNLRRANAVLLDFAQDVWRYISDGWIGQRAVKGEVGSSAMPHKVNPIQFENAEGNLGLANALCEFFSRKLPISRLQRDLSDSTAERNFGAAFGHSLVAYRYLLEGLRRVAVHRGAVSGALAAHPEVVAEAIQTILRREGAAMPYEKLKALTRGREVTLKSIHQFIDSLDITPKLKKELKKITPGNYTGLAEKLARSNHK
ncbi:MAG: adenylosuccinate lyase [Candidatus Liptonbacteria bacterium]|nr:adenylosuccinate lyase [Candidatus Liptonbacteria bacterium]